MMPGLIGLRPPVTPFLPGAGVDPTTLPAAKPTETVRLKDGDTLDLTAGLVRRTIRGQQFVMYAFNGMVPGPLIRVAQQATITVRFHNRIDLPSAVHWHGLRHDEPVRRRARTDAGRGRAGRRLHVSRCTFPTRASTGITRTSARTSSRRWACSAT